MGKRVCIISLTLLFCSIRLQQLIVAPWAGGRVRGNRTVCLVVRQLGAMDIACPVLALSEGPWWIFEKPPITGDFPAAVPLVPSDISFSIPLAVSSWDL